MTIPKGKIKKTESGVEKICKVVAKCDGKTAIARTKSGKTVRVKQVAEGSFDTKIKVRVPGTNGRPPEVLEIPCFRLECKTLVLTQDGMARMLGFDKGSNMARALRGDRIKPYLARSMGRKDFASAPFSAQSTISPLLHNGLTSAPFYNIEPLVFEVPNSPQLAKVYPTAFFQQVYDAYAAAAADGQLTAHMMPQFVVMATVVGQFARHSLDALVRKALGDDSDRIIAELERSLWISPERNKWRLEYDREFCELVAMLFGKDPARLSKRSLMGYSGAVAHRDILCRLPGDMHRALLENEATARHQWLNRETKDLERGYNWFVSIRDHYKREMKASLKEGYGIEQHRNRWDVTGSPFPKDSLWFDQAERKVIQEQEELAVRQINLPFMDAA